KNWKFSAFLGAFFLVYSWILQSVSKLFGSSGESFLGLLADSSLELASLREVGGALFRYLRDSPPALLILLLLVFGLYGFADARKWPLRALLGGLHAAAQLLLLLVLLWAAAHLNLNLLNLEVDGFWRAVLFGLELLVCGGLLGGLLMGVYLWLANRLLGCHSNEVFLCQSIPGHKHFVRLHRDRDGRLTIYPIAVHPVPRGPRGWRFDAQRAREGRSWFEPAEGGIGDLTRLIETPIRVDQET
ncbi:MAG: hypothetical protein R3190_18890, partial [Thermoanaerobaculia bacterium]|nr:hypothetical protein [Thermoanaerobaculia bacterium]